MEKSRIALITYGNRNHGSTRVRVLNQFEKIGGEFDLIWLPRTGLELRRTFYEKFKFYLTKKINCIKMHLFLIFGKYDLVFVQIMFLPVFLLKVIRLKKALLVYDFDDAVYTYSQRAFNNMLAYCNGAIISTPFLEEYIPAGKQYRIIYSAIDTDKITPSEKIDGVFTIGWVGSPDGIHHLIKFSQAFVALSKKIKFRLLLVGATAEIPGVNIESIAWSEANEIAALKQIDVGIMPLDPDDPWSPKKGGYKLLMYMAAGLPLVASPSGINGLIVKENRNGFLANTGEEWCDAIEKLYKSEALRAEFGQYSRRLAEEIYSYSVCSVQLKEFINEILRLKVA